VLERRPDLRAPVVALFGRYAELRYGPTASAAEVAAFARAVARFSVPAGPAPAAS
jgi:hypothetical protein